MIHPLRDRSTRIQSHSTICRWGSMVGNIGLLAAIFGILRPCFESGGRPEASMSEGRLKAVFRSSQGTALSFSWSPDGRTIATAGLETTVQIRDLITGLTRTIVFGGAESLGNPRKLPSRIVAFSPDRKSLAVGTSGGTVILWDTRLGRSIARLDGFRLIDALSWSPDGQTLAVAAIGEEIRLWNISEARTITLRLSSTAHTNLAFSPDGRFLAEGGADGWFRLWDASTGDLRLSRRSHPFGVSFLAFTPDGESVITTSPTAPSRMWVVASGHERVAPGDPSHGHSVVSFSPNGKWFACSSGDGYINLWEIASNREVARMEGHTAPVKVLAWSPDGRTLASTSYDATAKLWDLADFR